MPSIPPRTAPPSIEEHGIIGDLRTAALVATDGTIDFLCAPDFDSPSIFARLLDRNAGHFSICPALEAAGSRQMYMPDSNVLITRFLAREGIAEVIDFMPVCQLGHAQSIVRLIGVVRGRVPLTIELAPRFAYAQGEHAITPREGALGFFPRGGGPPIRLRGSCEFGVHDGVARASLDLAAGESRWVGLELPSDAGGRPIDSEERARAALDATAQFWRRWLAACTYRGRWREEVHRAALALKLMSSEEHGAMVAAATFGLPEETGGVRNWDYRYVWPRDASFAVRALARIGFADEADRFIRWLEPVCRSGRDLERPLRVMYRLDGGTELEERALHHLAGYRDSRPVLIGNRAHTQLQLDIYGELLDALALHDANGWPVHHDLWSDVVRIADWVCDNWNQPDEGIWETRGGCHEFLVSRVMCWVALDRACRLSISKSRPAPLERWVGARDRIYADVYSRYWDAELGAFTQYPGGKALDASSLLLPLYGFIGPTDPRWLSTLDAIERRLCEGALVYRYRKERAADDGLEGQEGSFAVCSFWLAECLARAGQVGRARLVFELMLSHANHLGLYAEEIGLSGEQLGNFPQALTLLGLIGAAVDLDQRLSAAEHSAPTRGPGA